MGNPSSQENLVVVGVRTYARIRLGTSLSLSLIWSPSYAKSNTKTFFGLLRVNLNVIETCKNTVLLVQHFFFSCFLVIWTFHFNLNEAVV